MSRNKRCFPIRANQERRKVSVFDRSPEIKREENKMISFKRIGSFLMAVLMSAVLVACGSTAVDTPSGNDAGTISQGGTTAPDTTAGETTDDPGDETTEPGGNVLVVYYSASGNTDRVAKAIADVADADLFELVPTDPYTSEDLSWTTAGSRVNREHDDESLRDIELESTTVENWDDYDTVFIGYPIWWGIAAWPVDNFVKDNDFTGKTVIPFCTSASSGLGQSGKLLAEMAGTGDWQDGQRFSSGASESTVAEWVDGLGLAG